MATTDDFMRNLQRNQTDSKRNTQQGRDEIDGVTGMGRTTAAFIRDLDAAGGSNVADVGRAVVQARQTLADGITGGAQSFGGGAYQALGDGLEMAGFQDNWAQKQAAYNHAQVQAKQQAAVQNYKTDVAKDVGSGLYSAGATAPLAFASMVSRNPTYMTGGAGVQTAADTYVSDRQGGASVIPSLINAIGQGSAEVLGEALPSQALVGMAARGINPGRVGSYALGELGGEAATGLVQDATGTAVHNNNAQGWQGFNERIPDTIQSSVIGGMVQGGVNMGMIPVTNAARDVVQSFQQQSQQPSTLNQANQAVGAANSTAAFMAKLDAGAAAQPQPQQPQPQAPVQPQQQAPVNPKAQSSLLTSLQEMTIFKTRTDVPTVQQLTGQQASPKPVPVRPQQNATINQAVQNTVNKIIGVESSGDANAKNKQSSARGLGQFVDGTWLDMIKRYRPDLTGQGDAAVLAMKTNPQLSREMTARYVQENAGILKKAGLPVTEANLYLAHFSGPQTAVNALRANPNAPASSVYGADQINSNKSVLANKSIGEVVAWANQKMGGAAASGGGGFGKFSIDGLKVKGGSKGQAVGGGSSHGAVFGVAHLFNDVTGGKYTFTSFNDHFHKGKASKHNQGLSFDLGVGGAEQEANVGIIRSRLQALGLTEGKDADFRVWGEKAGQANGNGTVSTGDHIHFEFRSQAAADKAMAAMQQGGQSYDGASPVESDLADTSMFDDDSGNEAMHDAAKAQQEATEELQDVVRKLGKQTTVRIGDEKADADMMLIDALDLSPSVAGTENQYRDRNRAASQIQVNKIANELDPEILGDSKLIDTGAPTLAADGKTIIGGNGRTMGILQAYEQGNGQQYKDYIANHAAEFGINAADVLGMERPVLVRKLRSGDIDVGKAAVASNENSGLAMSALEQARVDSGRLPNFGSLQFSDDGNLNIPANRNFIRDFVGQMPTTMQATMVDAQGNLSQDGYRRMQNAILHRAYGNTPALSRMVESSDQGTRNLLTAMMKSAPKIAAAKDAIKNGNMHDADIADDLVGAVETINQLRTEGRSVADYLAQQGMFAEDLSPVARELVAFLDDNIRSAKKISELIEAYYDVLSEQGSPNQDDIFGENAAPTKEQIYDTAKQQHNKRNAEPEQSGIFDQQTERSTEQPAGSESTASTTTEQRGQTERIDQSSQNNQQQATSTASNGRGTAQNESKRGDEAGAGENAGGVEKQQDGLKFSRGAMLGDKKKSDPADFNEALQQAGGFAAYEAAKAAGETELTFHQWQQVRTPEFKAWFGDWENDPDNASKVVNDKTGEPLVVYHGGNADITTFDHKKATDKMGRERALGFGKGKFYLSKFDFTATSYAKARSKKGDGFVGSYFVNIRNPITSDEYSQAYRELTGKEITQSYDAQYTQKQRDANIAKLDKQLKAQGYDGMADDLGQITVYNPNQIKSATDNSGAFDAGNADIRYSRNTEKDIDAKISDIEAAIQDTVGDLAQHIEVVSAYDMFPADVAKSYIDGNAEGAYFPKDRKIYILAESMTPERARWVAWHELGHRGFDTPQFKNYQALVTQARNNPIVEAVAKAIMKDRRQYADDRAGTDINVATEEAIVELLAASKTGNYAEIEKRYGVKAIQPEFKTTLQRLLDKFKALMAKVTGHAASDFTNEDVMDLLRSIEMAAAEDVQGGRDGEAKLSRAKENIADFVDRVIDDKTLREQLDILDVTDKEVDVAQSNGLDISSYSHMIDSSAVNHILKNHGNAQTEQKRGQIAITKTDFEFMPDVIANPDKTIFGTKNNVGREQIVYLKKMQDGSLLMIEEQRTGRKRLALHTMRKYPATTDDSSIERTLLSNAQGDSGNELSIVNHLEDDNKNKDVLFSRKQKLSWNYLTSRNQMKEFQAGVDAFNWITQSLQPWLDKVGMANNTPSLVRQYMRDYKASLNVASQKAKIFAEQAKQLTQAEREFLSDVIENELPEGVIVSPEIQQLVIAIRAMMNKQTDDLLALQMIPPESAERFRDTYLPRIYSKAIKQRDGMFSIRKEWQKAKQGIDGKHLRGRGIIELVNASEQALWESRGYEKRYDAAADSNGSARVIMWRDYSKQERVEMGENRDAALRVLTGYLSTQKDIGLGTLYLRIASNPQLASKTEVPGWILVSNDSIAGSVHIKKYGAMAGMYVDPATLSAIDTSILLQSKFPRVWLWALTTWKVTKTVFNPVAHFNNVASNFQMYLMAGGKMRDLWKASQSLRKKDQFYQEALEQGLVGDFVDNAGLYDMFGGIGGMKEAEAAGNFIERLMQRADKLSTMKLVLGSMGAGAAYGAAMGGVAGAAVGGALGASTGGLYKMKEKAKALYSMEDEVFRMALYKLARDRGLSESDAVGYAQQYMFDYSDIPPAVRFARDSGAIPFVTYTYKAVPAMLRLMLTRPHRVALNMALLWGINKASYFFLGLDGDDEDEERKYMPDYQKGMTAMSIPFTDMGIPKLLRMPFNDENGDPVYLDIMRMTPLGDFWDWTNQNGGIPMPNWGTPNGPIFGHFAAGVTNKDLFSGRPLVNDTMSTKEKTQIYTKYIASQWLPSSPGFAGSYHTNNILDGLKSQFEDTVLSNALEDLGYTGTNYRGEEVELKRALLGAGGIKIRGQSVSEQKQKALVKLNNERKALKSEITKTRKNGTMTDARKQAKIEDLQERLKILSEKMKEFHDAEDE